MGGFVTTAARLARSNFRPLVLPPPGKETTSVKRAYDILATFLSVTTLNYVTAPFMMSTIHNSFIVWSRLGFYGHFTIFGALLFFFLGGTSYCRKLQARRGLLPPKAKVTANGIRSGESTPIQEKNFMVPPPIDNIVPSIKLKE
jgi:lysophospholipid acyltransferase